MYLFAMGAPMGRGHLYNVRKEQGLLYKKNGKPRRGGGGGQIITGNTFPSFSFYMYIFTVT